MSDPAPALLPDPTLARERDLDALAGMLPFDARERLAVLLTDEDAATLKHLARSGMGANTLRALASDLGYLEAWCLAATGHPLPWPATEALALKFVAHHLWDPAERESDPRHGMPSPVEDDLRDRGLLRVAGPHAVSTVRRRLAHWSTLHRFRGVDGPFKAPRLRTALSLAVRANRRPRARKSQRAVTAAVIEKLLTTCLYDHRLVDVRDRALLLVAFASGGRRRAEVAGLRVEDLVRDPPVPLDPGDPEGAKVPKFTIRLGRTKTTTAEDDARVVVIGRAATALLDWLALAKIETGAVFRRIDRWGRLGSTALDPQSVNAILKARCARAGLDPALFSAHGLRSGFMTEAGKQGVPLPEAMQLSQHRSVQQAARYYNEAEIDKGKAVRLIG
ncbi:site-specific integrase [Methylobacterium tarhaniae]|uniref:site-specific integrase n=1 Tax=Methylobacterium tarhaniae TaxID=1187852 RepID=UPI003D0091F8